MAEHHALAVPGSLVLRAPAAAFPAEVPSLGNLDAYISAVHRMPMLSLDEERNLARAWR